MTRQSERVAETGAPQVVEEEERLLSVVQQALERAERRTRRTDYDLELLRLRDALAEEKLPDDQAAIVEQMDRLSALSATRARHVEGTVDPSSPYFAHMRIEDEDGSRRDILLGKRTFVSDGVRIVDWRNAPISSVFYRTREGETFDESIAGRTVSGEVLARRMVTVVNGRLVRVHAPQGTFLHTPHGWRDVSGDDASLQGGAGTAIRPDTARPILGTTPADLRTDKHLPEIAGLLDPEQFDLITSPGSGLVAIQGGAGSGKTTVGLHRLAYLNYRDPARYRADRMLILVFSIALSRYISRVLPALGVRGVPVKTLETWAGALRQQHYPGLTKNRNGATPASVVRFKTHRVLIPMLDDAARTAAPRSRPTALFDELFTDRTWLKQGVDRWAPGAFSAQELDEIHRWCTDQHFWRAEGGGPNEDDVPGYDTEDDMILLRLHQLLVGPLMHSRRSRLQYDHVMVDEAQDFSPLELLVVLETVRDGAITLAGDTAQKITEGNDFSDWSEVLGAIGHSHVKVSPLQVSYRSTRQILEVARHVLGPLAPDEPLRAPRSGAPVELFRCGGPGEAMAFLADVLTDLTEREPLAGVAVLCRYPHQADEVYEAVRRADLQSLRRVRDQDFSFGPGIEVTDIAQTKGLEFDYVIVLPADAETFPETDASRHLLHVGATRAAHQLWLITWGPPSPLLPTWLPVKVAG